MPVRPLPPELVKRLKKSSCVISAYLGNMENLDHRPYIELDDSRDTHSSGGRVREMNISKNFPNEKLVIKRAHTGLFGEAEIKDDAPARIIKHFSELVDKHNSLFKPGDYELRKPIIYDIGYGLIAMAKTDAPSIEEMIHEDISRRTERGRTLMRNLIKEHKISVTKFKEICETLRTRTHLPSAHLLVLGVENGKIIFMPLPDVA